MAGARTVKLHSGRVVPRLGCTIVPWPDESLCCAMQYTGNITSTKQVIVQRDDMIIAPCDLMDHRNDVAAAIQEEVDTWVASA